MNFIRYTNAIDIFYQNLDMIADMCRNSNRKVVMFGSGIPAHMTISYLKNRDVPVDAIVDNNQQLHGKQKSGITIYNPDTYLKNFDESVLVLIASAYQDAMIKQLEDLGYTYDKHIFKIIDLPQSIQDYSFCKRENMQQMDRTQIRQHQLRVLKHLKTICEKHGLRYWLCGGTLLGAVRHQGYIPWDDDIDILVEMKDLKKLTDLLKKDSEFAIATYVDEEIDFFDSCSYMYERNSIMDINYFPMQASCGVNIDLFPLVGLPSNPVDFEHYMKTIRNLQEEIWDNIFDKTKLRQATTDLMYFMSQYDYDQCSDCGYVLSRHATKEKMPVSYYNEPEMMLFEREYYNVPKEWDKYLRKLFGDNYMQLPPEKERVAHHNFRAYETVPSN
jgi:lipopolysaccharide cholinephosphotransferase